MELFCLNWLFCSRCQAWLSVPNYCNILVFIVKVIYVKVGNLSCMWEFIHYIHILLSRSSISWLKLMLLCLNVKSISEVGEVK